MNDFINLHQLLGMLAGPGQGHRFDQVVVDAPMILGVPVVDGNALLDNDPMTISDLLTEATRNQWTETLTGICAGRLPSRRTAAEEDRRRIIATAGRAVRGTTDDLIAAMVGDASEGIWILAGYPNEHGEIESVARFQVTAGSINTTTDPTSQMIAAVAQALLVS